MRLYTVILLFVGILSSSADYPYTVGYYDQFIDHFNQMSYGEKTFKQKYLLQDKHWKPGVGPIFFYAGNEGPIEAFWGASGFVHEIAPEFEALVVFPEHRFYGDSLPFGNKSFDRPYLGLLTVEQAMADYAIFLSDLKMKRKATNCKVIAFGGSYGGMLAAYMRFKYPNIVDGSLAASAPIFMQAATGPRDFFFPLVTKDFQEISQSCVNRVKQAFIDLNYLSKQGQQGFDEISSTFSLCDKLQNAPDYRHLLGWVRNAFTMMAMLDYPYPTDFMAKMPAYPVKAACQFILNGSTPMEGLRGAAGMFYNSSVKCFDIKSEFIECADPTGCGTGPNAIAWDFQACTDLALPHGSNNVTDMFPVLPWTAQMRHDYCLKTYGVVPRQMVPAVELWGEKITSATNIIFSNGNLDPWRGGGLNHSLSDSLVAIEVEGGAHHLDLRGGNPMDPPGVVKAREKERSIIRNWVNAS